jgi:hypothetical protein
VAVTGPVIGPQYDCSIALAGVAWTSQGQ